MSSLLLPRQPRRDSESCLPARLFSVACVAEGSWRIDGRLIVRRSQASLQHLHTLVTYPRTSALSLSSHSTRPVFHVRSSSSYSDSPSSVAGYYSSIRTPGHQHHCHHPSARRRANSKSGHRRRLQRPYHLGQRQWLPSHRCEEAACS